MAHKVLITIGDWSEDGHNCYDMFTFKSSHSREELQKAYRKSCEVSGVQFHGDGGIDQICVDFEDCVINCYQLMMLHKAFRLDMSNLPETIPDFSMNGFSVTKPEYFALLVLWFIGKSLNSFEHSRLVKVPKFTDPKPEEFWDMTLNGWWGELNEGFGYGIYKARLHKYEPPINVKKLSDDKVYFITKDSRQIHEATKYVEELPSIVMDSDFLYGVKYWRIVANNHTVPLIKSWAAENLRGKIFQFENRYFYEYEDDVKLFAQQFVTDTFLRQKFPYLYEQIEEGEYHFFDEEIADWCQNNLGDPYWYSRYGQYNMPDPNPNGEWAMLYNRSLYLTLPAATLFKLYWAGKEKDVLVSVI